jgi:hypothetical protein
VINQFKKCVILSIHSPYELVAQFVRNNHKRTNPSFSGIHQAFTFGRKILVMKSEKEAMMFAKVEAWERSGQKLNFLRNAATLSPEKTSIVQCGV